MQASWCSLFQHLWVASGLVDNSMCKCMCSVSRVPPQLISLLGDSSIITRGPHCHCCAVSLYRHQTPPTSATKKIFLSIVRGYPNTLYCVFSDSCIRHFSIIHQNVWPADRSRGPVSELTMETRLLQRCWGEDDLYKCTWQVTGIQVSIHMKYGKINIIRAPVCWCIYTLNNV